MQYEPNKVYHIYNQGNNKQPIFFSPENYHFFLTKMHKHLKVNVDILAYCLMPNHFHFLVLTKECACQQKYPDKLNNNMQTLSHNLAILLRSYTRAINKQNDRTGSLFRPRTKAKNGIIDGFIVANNQDDNLNFDLRNDYHRVCFEYIHNNPVKAQLCAKAIDWEYSSAKDYAGLRNDDLCNKQLSKQLGFLG